MEHHKGPKNDKSKLHHYNEFPHNTTTNKQDYDDATKICKNEYLFIDQSNRLVLFRTRFFQASNCTMLEYLNAPSSCIYRKDMTFATRAKQLADECQKRKPLACKYLAFARHNSRDYLDGKDVVKLKKYFYVLRCCKFVNRPSKLLHCFHHQLILLQSSINICSLSNSFACFFFVVFAFSLFSSSSFFFFKAFVVLQMVDEE